MKTMGRRKKKSGEKLDVPFTIRMKASDVARIDRLAEQLPLKTAGHAREAIMIGLAALEDDPTILFRKTKE